MTDNPRRERHPPGFRGAFTRMLRHCHGLWRKWEYGPPPSGKAQKSLWHASCSISIGSPVQRKGGVMIPDLAELRRRLLPDLASDSTPEENPQISAPSARSAPPASRDFLVLRQNLPKFGHRSRIVCRLCRKPPECSVILRPRHQRARPAEISRSSLEGWLKHDFTFFGESYLCEACAKSQGFI
jgi:hypothetical protein